MSYTAPSNLAGTTLSLVGTLTWDPSTTPAPATVLLLTFDGTNGQTAITDTSPVANVMTNHGGALSTTTPKFGSACGNFAGGGWNTPLSPGSPLDLHQTAFTVSGWIRNPSGRQQIIWSDLAYPSGDSSYCRAYAFGGTVDIQLNYGSSLYAAGGPVSINIDDGNWHHWVCSVDVLSHCGVAIDGVWGAINSYAFDSGPVSSGQPLFQLGYDGLSGIQGTSFTGELDQMSIALSTTWPLGTNFTPPATPPGSPSPGYDVYRDGVSIATFLGPPGFTDTVPVDGIYSYQVFAWDGTSDVSSGSNVIDLLYGLIVPVYGKFVQPGVFKPNVQVAVGLIEPRVWMPFENRTVRP